MSSQCRQSVPCSLSCWKWASNPFFNLPFRLCWFIVVKCFIKQFDKLNCVCWPPSKGSHNEFVFILPPPLALLITFTDLTVKVCLLQKRQSYFTSFGCRHTVTVRSVKVISSTYKTHTGNTIKRIGDTPYIWYQNSGLSIFIFFHKNVNYTLILLLW